MRFPIAAIFLVISMFALFIVYAVLSFLLDTISDTLTPLADMLTSSSRVSFLGEIGNMELTFGVAMVTLFILLIVVFVVDSLRQQSEYYEVR